MSRLCAVALIVGIATFAGCSEKRLEVRSQLDTTLSDRDRDALTPETRLLYDALIAGTLAGAPAADYQTALDTADEIISRDHDYKQRNCKIRVYVFELTSNQSAEYKARGEPYEGPPIMSVAVQEKYGHIYSCGISLPTW